jgi:hypothetical protein
LHLGDPLQHVTEDKSLRNPPPSERTNSTIEFQHISPQDAYEDHKMAAHDLITNSLPCKEISASFESHGTSPLVCEDQQMDFAAAEPQGTSLPGCEGQKMVDPGQITEPLPSQDTIAAVEPQGTSPTSEDQIMAAPDQIAEYLFFQDPQGTLATSEDQIMAAPDQITELLLSQDTSPSTEPQGTSPQVVAEGREIIHPHSVRGPSILQQPNDPQDCSSQNFTQDQEIKASDTTEVSLPFLDACVATKPRNSPWKPTTDEQEKQGMAAGDSEDSASLPSQKLSSAIDTHGSAAMSISKDDVTSSLQSSPQILNPLVSSNHVENSPSPDQDVRPLITPPASADSLVIGSPRSTMTGEILRAVFVTYIII